MSQSPTELSHYSLRADAAKLRIAQLGEKAAYLTTAEAAAYLNYSESHFRALVRAGKVPQPIRINGKLL